MCHRNDMVAFPTEPTPHLSRIEKSLTGRPTIYSDDLAERICEQLSSGQSLRAICRDDAMPAEGTVRGWVIDNRGGFSAQYARAREIQAHVMADELLDIADDASNDWMVREGRTELNSEHIQRSRLRSDTRKWLLSKMLPKVYGDKMQHSGEGEGGSIVVQVLTGVNRGDDD